MSANHIVCLDCGKHFSVLRRHLMTDHKRTPEQHLALGVARALHPLVAPDYAKTRSSLAKKFRGWAGRVRQHRRGRRE